MMLLVPKGVQTSSDGKTAPPSLASPQLQQSEGEVPLVSSCGSSDPHGPQPLPGEQACCFQCPKMAKLLLAHKPLLVPKLLPLPPQPLSCWSPDLKLPPLPLIWYPVTPGVPPISLSAGGLPSAPGKYPRSGETQTCVFPRHHLGSALVFFNVEFQSSFLILLFHPQETL